MKNNLFIFSILCLFLVACDHIAENDRLIEVQSTQPADDVPTATARAVLLEDFTGQRCVNCPTGTEVIEQLQEAYGDQLIAVGVHSGPLGFKGNAKNIGLATDLGDEYYNYWKLEYQPVGLINRHGAVNYTDWTAEVVKQLNMMSEIKLELEAKLQSEQIIISVKGQNLGDDYKGKLQVWVLEDGIVAMQSMPDGTVNREYVHNHVLRTAVNGTWGDAIDFKEAETKALTYSQTVDAAWNKANLSVVAFVYNDDGVEQAAKTKVTE